MTIQLTFETFHQASIVRFSAELNYWDFSKVCCIVIMYIKWSSELIFEKFDQAPKARCSAVLSFLKFWQVRERMILCLDAALLLVRASHCNTLPHTEAYHAAKRCNTLQHTATHCNMLQHAATRCHALQRTATHCNTFQQIATHCNTLQHTATHCNAR